MASQPGVIVFYDERMLAHFPDTNAEFLPGRLDKRVRSILSGLYIPWKYPEHPGRITAIMDLLAREPIEGVSIEPGKAATMDQLSRVHTKSFLDDIFSLRDQSAWLDVDTTAVSPGSVQAAEVAAGTAIAAAHAQDVLGCKRVLIVDWDAHPGTGALTDVGAGRGEGTTVNVPMPGGACDIAYLKAMREILVPAGDTPQEPKVCGIEEVQTAIDFHKSAFDAGNTSE